MATYSVFDEWIDIAQAGDRGTQSVDGAIPPLTYPASFGLDDTIAAPVVRLQRVPEDRDPYQVFEAIYPPSTVPSLAGGYFSNFATFSLCTSIPDAHKLPPLIDSVSGCSPFRSISPASSISSGSSPDAPTVCLSDISPQPYYVLSLRGSSENEVSEKDSQDVLENVVSSEPTRGLGLHNLAFSRQAGLYFDATSVPFAPVSSPTSFPEPLSTSSSASIPQKRRQARSTTTSRRPSRVEFRPDPPTGWEIPNQPSRTVQSLAPSTSRQDGIPVIDYSAGRRRKFPLQSAVSPVEPLQPSPSLQTRRIISLRSSSSRVQSILQPTPSDASDDMVTDDDATGNYESDDCDGDDDPDDDDYGRPRLSKRPRKAAKPAKAKSKPSPRKTTKPRHTKGKRGFHCPEPGCDRTFTRNSDAQRHFTSIHQAVKQYCPHCLKKLSRKDAVTRHATNSEVCNERAAKRTLSMDAGDQNSDE